MPLNSEGYPPAIPLYAYLSTKEIKAMVALAAGRMQAHTVLGFAIILALSRLTLLACTSYAPAAIGLFALG